MKVFYASLIVATLLAQCTVFADECADATSTGTSTTETSSQTTASSTKSSDSGSDLLSVDLTSIGGAGTNITEATETEVDGVSYCYVEGYLPPQAKWMMQLPISTWTQRYLQAGCDGLCGPSMVSLSRS